ELVIKELNTKYEELDSLKGKVVHRKDKSDWSLTFGVTGAPSTSLSAKYSNLTETFRYTSSFVQVRDTAELIQDQEGKVKLPLSLGFGFMLKQGSRWLIGSDFTMQNWK